MAELSNFFYYCERDDLTLSHYFLAFVRPVAFQGIIKNCRIETNPSVEALLEELELKRNVYGGLL